MRFIMRICDVMLSFPSILIALLIAGVGHALFPNAHDTLAFGVLIIAIALPGWVQYARTVRGSTMVERQQGIRAGGARHRRVAAAHHAAATCCPTCMGPVLVLSTIQVADGDPHRGDAVLSRRRRVADLAVAGHVHQRRQQAAVQRRLVARRSFPASMLVLIALSVNLFGDWLRDALNPRLR